ncbi:MAG: type 11 methyltransferase [Planctomycetota bacterium]|nr:MAG: type 11 methyltransferase [Planctomycetota bacterium]
MWGGLDAPEQSEQQAEQIWELLELTEGSRVLDAPCGYGRIALPLARRGARVLGVDQSAVLLEHAERAREREGLSSEQLRYRRHDLREPLPEQQSFEVALNLFTSLGYGSEEDDLAILRALARAVRPGGRVLIETMHRDTVVARLARGLRPAHRLADGTLVLEQPRFDALAGRVQTCWWWWGPLGHGVKHASLRVYTATELVALAARAGLRLLAAHAGCSREPFQPAAPEMGGRLGLVFERP